MRFLPFDRYTYVSHLSADEVRRRLHLNVEPRKTFSYYWRFKKTPRKAYEGSVDYSFFNINRVINYRNSFLPFISGNIAERSSGCEVKLVLRMLPFVTVFWGIWMTAVGAIFLFIIYKIIFDPASVENGFLGIVLTLAMFAFGYLLAMIAFKSESSRTRRFFAKLLEVQPSK